jgi:hypothetical protein
MTAAPYVSAGTDIEAIITAAADPQRADRFRYPDTPTREFAPSETRAREHVHL